jgi:hypothetical protein
VKIFHRVKILHRVEIFHTVLYFHENKSIHNEIFKAYGAPSSWTLRDDTQDDSTLEFVPPTTPP